jgi:mannosyltransferase PIG-V
LPVVTAWARLQSRRGLGPAAEIFLWSRAGIWLTAVFAYLWFEPKPPPLQKPWDRPELHDVGYGIDIWARWDTQWFVRIAEHGYDVAREAPAFFPLYPALMGVLGRAFGGHYVVAGVVLSLAAAFVAFVLLYQLAEERLGPEGARRAVVYLAVFPMSLFLQAAYSESLFLALALGAFVLAERKRFGWAGVVCGLALLTRNAGIALVPALAVIAWPSRAALARLAVGPLLFLAYPLVLWAWIDDPWAWVHQQERIWHRHLSAAGPLGGIWDALTKWHPSGTEVQHAAMVNLESLVFLVLFVALTVLAWRWFGAAYGLFAALSLALPLSVPSERWPLLSLPRFGLVVFPFFLALAVLGERPRVHNAIVAVSAMLLGVAVVQWVLYQWVA